MQYIKKLIHIKDAGRFHQNTVVSAHTHSNEFCFKAAPVTVCVTPACHHFQSAVLSKNILKQHCIHVYSTEIIF